MINPAHQSKDFAHCMRECSRDCDSVLEPGSGFGRNLQIVQRPKMVGIEIHAPYLSRVWLDSRVRYVQGDALLIMEAMELKSFDGILIVDFLEHLERPQGDLLLQYSERIARKRIWIWVPEGLHPQHEDQYKLGADIPQTHKSTWYAKDLEAVGYDVAVWPRHFQRIARLYPEATGNAMFALKELGG